MKKIFKSIAIIIALVLITQIIQTTECPNFTENHLICEDDYNEYISQTPEDIQTL